MNETKLSYIDRINLLNEFSKSSTGTSGSGKTDEDLPLVNRILIEPISNKKDGQNIVFIYKNANMIMVNFNQNEKDDHEDFKINNLKLPDFGCVCKMKWISAHKIEKLF